MAWIGLYLSVGLVVAMAASVAGDRLRSGRTDHAWVFVMLAGLLWPVTLLGLTQLLILAVLRTGAERSTDREEFSVGETRS